MELGRRERQIMEAVYRLGRATVAEVRAELPDPPSYSAIEVMIALNRSLGAQPGPAVPDTLVPPLFKRYQPKP